jgi:hypothetical protein
VFTLDEVVPWGRSFDEYCQMFALGDTELARTILGCGDGPAGFNAEATRRGASVVSVDPVYRWEAADIRQRIAATADRVLDEARRNQDEFVWDTIRSVDDLGRLRMAAMSDFLSDYPAGKAQGRYLDAALPALPFSNGSFDLALCSHLLFLYSTQLGESFHLDAIQELCRIAREVRIFPLLALGGRPSPFVDFSVAKIRAAGHDVAIERVAYEFQRGGNQMMCIRTHW